MVHLRNHLMQLLWEASFRDLYRFEGRSLKFWRCTQRKKVGSPKALQRRGDHRLGHASPRNLGARKCHCSSVLSTGHFSQYERKCKWLEYILPISSVVIKVQCLRKKGKTVMPSRKLQAKGERPCMTAVSSRLYCETSLVIKLAGYKGYKGRDVYPSDGQKTPI